MSTNVALPEFTPDTAKMQASLNRIMSNVIDTTERPAFRGMIYGKDGGGKSVLAMKILQLVVPPEKRILMFDTSGSYVSLTNHPGLLERVKPIQFTTYEDINIVSRAISMKIPPFDTVGGVLLDEVSSMVSEDLIRVYEASINGAYGEKVQAESVKEGKPAWGEYNREVSRFTDLYTNLFRNTNVSVVATAHQRNLKNPQTQQVIGFGPNFPPSLETPANAKLQLVARLETVVSTTRPGAPPTYNRIVQVHPTLMVAAKTRIPFSKASVSADELPAMIKAWLESGAKEIDAPLEVQPEFYDNTELLPSSAFEAVSSE